MCGQALQRRTSTGPNFQVPMGPQQAQRRPNGWHGNCVLSPGNRHWCEDPDNFHFDFFQGASWFLFGRNTPSNHQMISNVLENVSNTGRSFGCPVWPLISPRFLVTAAGLEALDWELCGRQGLCPNWLPYSGCLVRRSVNLQTQAGDRHISRRFTLSAVWCPAPGPFIPVLRDCSRPLPAKRRRRRRVCPGAWIEEASWVITYRQVPGSPGLRCRGPLKDANLRFARL